MAAQQTVATLERGHLGAPQHEPAIVRYKEGASDYTTVLTAEQQQLGQLRGCPRQRPGGVPLALVSVYRALAAGSCVEGQDLLPAPIRQEMKART